MGSVNIKIKGFLTCVWYSQVMGSERVLYVAQGQRCMGQEVIF